MLGSRAETVQLPLWMRRHGVTHELFLHAHPEFMRGMPLRARAACLLEGSHIVLDREPIRERFLRCLSGQTGQVLFGVCVAFFAARRYQ